MLRAGQLCPGCEQLAQPILAEGTETPTGRVRCGCGVSRETPEPEVFVQARIRNLILFHTIGSKP